MGLKKKESSKTIETLEFPYVEKKKKTEKKIGFRAINQIMATHRLWPRTSIKF